MSDVNIFEKWAQCLVTCAMDVPKAWELVFADRQDMLKKFKSDKTREREFLARWGNNPGLWKRVAQLQQITDAAIAVKAADVVNYWTAVANGDRRKMVQIVDVPCHDCEGKGCPKCGGVGTAGQAVELAPTASYGPDEIAAYEGAEATKHGIKLITATKADAWDKLGRYFGMFNDKLLLERVGGDAVPELPPLPDDPQEAARIYAEWVKK